MRLTSDEIGTQAAEVEEDFGVNHARVLLEEIDARLKALRIVPAETLAKVRLPWISDGREGVIGSAVFLDHLLAGVQFNQSRLRLHTPRAVSIPHPKPKE